jgi:undecaprenyl-diphosphatase
MAWTLMILTILIRAIPWSWVFALIFALLMGFSRIHNGMHYPSDVLTGWLLWIAYWLVWIGASRYIHRYYHKRK